MSNGIYRVVDGMVQISQEELDLELQRTFRNGQVSRRDHFAAAALQGLLAGTRLDDFCGDPDLPGNNRFVSNSKAVAVELSAEFADALIAELDRKT